MFILPKSFPPCSSSRGPGALCVSAYSTEEPKSLEPRAFLIFCSSSSHLMRKCWSPPKEKIGWGDFRERKTCAARSGVLTMVSSCSRDPRAALWAFAEMSELQRGRLFSVPEAGRRWAPLEKPPKPVNSPETLPMKGPLGLRQWGHLPTRASQILLGPWDMKEFSVGFEIKFPTFQWDKGLAS